MSNKIELMSPLRISSYRDDSKNNQIFQWVVGEFEASQLTKWESVLDGSSAIVSDDIVIDLIKTMLFTVTKNTTAGNSILTMGDVPTLTNGGEVAKGGSITAFEVTKAIYDLNSFIIYKNGVKLLKGTDVDFVAVNQIKITSRLQVTDTISVEQLIGI